MKIKIREKRITAMIAMGVLVLFGSNAWANYPKISGVAICDEVSGNYRIDWVSEAWLGYGAGLSGRGK